MTLEVFTKIAFFLKKIGKNEHYMFMTENEFKEKFSFLDLLNSISIKFTDGTQHNGCFTSIYFQEITFYFIDPSLF